MSNTGPTLIMVNCFLKYRRDSHFASTRVCTDVFSIGKFQLFSSCGPALKSPKPTQKQFMLHWLLMVICETKQRNKEKRHEWEGSFPHPATPNVQIGHLQHPKYFPTTTDYSQSLTLIRTVQRICIVAQNTKIAEQSFGRGGISPR